MPSSRDDCVRRVLDIFEVWNRRLHFYIGLYLLFFLWLFAFTGLLLNHPGWTFAEFWPTRKQTAFERAITPPPVGPDLAQAENILNGPPREPMRAGWTFEPAGPAIFSRSRQISTASAQPCGASTSTSGA